jgi:hypothetical protein
MKKNVFLLFSFLCLLSVSIASARSLWDNGMNFYKINVKQGDIIKIRFLEKTIMKYKLEQRQNDYQSKKGVKGKGDIFSFFPDVEVDADDALRNQNNLSVDNEESFSINAKVTAVNNNTASFEGFHSTLINGEIFKLEISGEFDINSLGSGSSIASTDVYDLDFRVLNQSPTNAAMFNQDDLVFSTNYTDIVTNQVISSNNITNIQLTTNFSSFKLEFTGIRDSKKQELLMNYLNSMINLLFR